ncbi:hypothetical protein [Paucibacter sp. XJ19-41]|uniref:hypothetical protein n=1 Tax=Paucibacter sp. XJ19-41 TaxID=2927824 RepID=UPI00234B98D3|nr:hypothetical protein [Paucibacter sp. XJ19-41]MDC6170712.1 hypothetical protein [Paucibacter sp. XJ19-41]
MSSDAAKEFGAIQAIHGALAPLDEEAQMRVLTYIASLLGINPKFAGGRAAPHAASPAADTAPTAGNEPESGGADATPKSPATYGTFAELYAAANPKTNAEKALVVGYWLQVCEAAESFNAAQANKELTHLGHKLANITDAIDQMKNQKPMLMLQLKKSGSSQQARKLYKVSHEGIKRVEAMIRG